MGFGRKSKVDGEESIINIHEGIQLQEDGVPRSIPVSKFAKKYILTAKGFRSNSWAMPEAKVINKAGNDNHSKNTIAQPAQEVKKIVHSFASQANITKSSLNSRELRPKVQEGNNQCIYPELDKGTGNTSSNDANLLNQVLRTQSAGELEYYRLTAGILHDQYRDVRDWYDVGEDLGEGSSGVIKKCVHKLTKQSYACKTICKSKLTCLEAVEDVQNEVKIMRIIGQHPSVVGLKETFEDYQAVHLILELCEGGDLYDRIQLKKQFSEMESARICRRLISALHHVHSLGYMHRDIKPENILLVSNESHVEIRVADFGQAVHLKPGQVLTQTVGSVFYVAPEILERQYCASADMWSVGVILYILLSGRPPFAGNDRRATFEMIRSAHLDMERQPWPKISPEARDMVTRMLDRNPNTRITAAQAKLHPWMMRYCPTIQTVPTAVPVKASIPSHPSGLHDGSSSPVSTMSLPASDWTPSPSSSNSSPSHGSHGVSRVHDLRRGQSADFSNFSHNSASSNSLRPGLPRCPSSSTSSPRSPCSEHNAGNNASSASSSPLQNVNVHGGNSGRRSLVSFASLPSPHTAAPTYPSGLPAPLNLRGSSTLSRKLSLDSAGSGGGVGVGAKPGIPLHPN